MENEDQNSSLLVKFINRGKLICVFSDVRKIGLTAEYVFRLNSNSIRKNEDIKQILCSKNIFEISGDTSFLIPNLYEQAYFTTICV